MKSATSPRPGARSSDKMSVITILSYVFDWIILVAVGVVGLILGDITPNMRPFSLDDPNISFPFTEKETVNSFWLMMCNSVFPVIIILIVALIFVPGSTVPEGTPKKLIWKRKLWELHTGWLGLALSLICAWIITQGMKNLFGKPRPDLLARCNADVDAWADHLAGYNNPPNNTYHGQLVKASICRPTDASLFDDGFRSYPSGHSSSAAAGLIYLSLFLASKFALTIPFVLPEAASSNATSASATAFPSRLQANRANTTSSSATGGSQAGDEFSYPDDPQMAQQIAIHHRQITAVRRQAAAPPLYLLVIAVLPFFTAIFIASSRWFDFRHHGFDILFGFIIGTITAWFAFRYYHLPLRSGAGWAWGPRSHDKAFWAGVGSYSYATNKKDWETPGDEEERMMTQGGANIELRNRSRTKLSSTDNVDTSYSPHAI